MSRPLAKPVSEILRTNDGTNGEAVASKNRADFREMKELEEQRKAGTAPAMVDVETGRDINPHIPEFIEKTPWYVNTDGPTLKHQRPHPERQKKLLDIDDWYKKGTTGRIAHKFRKGACDNCGAMGHDKKNCFDKPRKVGARFTGCDIAPDDFEQSKLSLTYDAKRDRWNGFDPSTYKDTVVKEHDEMAEISKVIKAEKIKSGEVAEDEDEDDDPDNMTPGQTVDMDSRTRITVRNLRIREDPANYLFNLNENGPYYDPKSRSMRENPFLGVAGKETEAAKFAGENFIKYTGEVVQANEAQVFAWQARCKGIDVHATAEPTKLEILQRKVEQEKNALKDSHKKDLLEKYGGEEHLEAPAKELLLAQSEAYVEYNRKGKVIKGEDKPLAKSKYEEDRLINNHTTVWGSYWKNGQWGFQCCHSSVKNSYCVGKKGYLIEDQTFTRMPTVEIVPATVHQELQPKTVELPSKKNVVVENRELEEDDESVTSDKEDKTFAEKVDGALSVEEDDEEEVDEATLKELEKEKEDRLRKEQRRETKREKRRRKKDRQKEKSKGKKKDKKRKRKSSSSESSGSDSSSSEDESSAKKAKYTPELRAAIKKAAKEQREGKLLKETSEKNQSYNSQYEVKAPTEVEKEAYNLVKILPSDPMAVYVQEQSKKK